MNKETQKKIFENEKAMTNQLKQSLKDLQNANESSDQITANLAQQAETIQMATRNVDKAQQSANNQIYITIGMKSIWGALLNIFTSPKQNNTDVSSSSTTASQKMKELKSSNSSADYGFNNKSMKTLTKQEPSPGMSEMDRIIQECNTQAARLLEKYALVGDELKDQNSKLNILQNKEAALAKSVQKIDKNLKQI